jgi:hypothetical protein
MYKGDKRQVLVGLQDNMMQAAADVYYIYTLWDYGITVLKLKQAKRSSEFEIC